MGKLLALDRALEPTLLALLGVQVDEVAWQALDPRQRRERTVEAAKRLLLFESRVPPDWIDSETQGFFEESVRAFVETGALAGERGHYRLGVPLPEIRVPATVQAVLAARMDRLPVEDRQLLQEAAVIGKEIPLALLQEG